LDFEGLLLNLSVLLFDTKMKNKLFNMYMPYDKKTYSWCFVKEILGQMFNALK